MSYSFEELERILGYPDPQTGGEGDKALVRIAELKAEREWLRKEALETHIRLNISDIPKLAEEVTYFLLPSTDESTVKRAERVIRETLMQLVMLPPPCPTCCGDGYVPDLQPQNGGMDNAHSDSSPCPDCKP